MSSYRLTPTINCRLTLRRFHVHHTAQPRGCVHSDNQGENSSLQIVALHTIGLELPDRNMPGWLARSAAKLLDLVWRLTLRRTPPPVDPHTAALLSRNCTLKIGKAQRELGYEPVTSREAGITALMKAGATGSNAGAGT